MTLLSIGSLIKQEFGYECVIAIPADAKTVSSTRISEAKARGFEIYRYQDKPDLDAFAKRRGITHTYVFSGGKRTDLAYFDKSRPESFRIGESVHITHVVFRSFDPHGEVYAYVSDWLFRWAKYRIIFWEFLCVLGLIRNQTPPKFLSFPHFIEPWPKKTWRLSLRQELGIPEDAHVIGRIGGYSEFDDPAARKGIVLILDAWEDSYAVFVNTPRFTNHPRAFFLEKMSRAEVRRFYDSCDLTLNGRRMGESFGYSIVEPLSLGKPVLAPDWVRNPLMDKHHIDLLKGKGFLYWSAKSLLRIYNKLRGHAASQYLAESVSMFTPEEAAKKLRAMLD